MQLIAVRVTRHLRRKRMDDGIVQYVIQTDHSDIAYKGNWMQSSDPLKLKEMKAERHWLGFDTFVWAAKQPIYTYVPPNPDYTRTDQITGRELYSKLYNNREFI
jgi:hypothetical protein